MESMYWTSILSSITLHGLVRLARSCQRIYIGWFMSNINIKKTCRRTRTCGLHASADSLLDLSISR